MHRAAADPALRANIIRMLVANGGDIHSEDECGESPLSLVTDPALRSDMVCLTRRFTRRSLLVFLIAVSVSENLIIVRSLRQVADNFDLVREVVTFV